jgi:NTE family protein
MTGTVVHPHPPGTLAVVIGSGSVLCAASVGMLRAFQAAGIEISMAVGSSGGSLYAALIALGASPETLHEMSLNLWSSDLFEGYASNLRQALSGEVRFTEKSSLIDDRAINQRLREVYGDRTFANTRLPLHVVATELYTGESVTLSEGGIFDAVRASIAIPLVFAPWQIGETWYVDGAVANPLPVDVAIREGARVIVALGF